MKALKVFGLLALAMINLTSCDSLFGTLPPESVGYGIALSFQDASGKDLVKGIQLDEWTPGSSMEDAQWGTVKSDLYSLNIGLSKACSDSEKGIGFELDNRHTLGMYRYDYNYLRNDYTLDVDDCPDEKVLTYKLKCPYIFGDETIHEIVTYWNIPKEKNANRHVAECYLIKFDGNEITPTTKDDKLVYAATIVLK